MRGYSLAMAFAAGTWACVPIQSLPALPDGEYLRLFLVSVNPEGSERAVVRASIPPGSSVVATALPESAELHLVALRSAALTGLHPDIALDRPEEIVLETSPDPEIFDPACATLGVSSQDEALTWPLGSRADVFRREDDRWRAVEPPESIARLGLHIPIDACSGLSFSVHPFGDRSPYLDSNTRVGGEPLGRTEIERLVRIGPEEILLVSERAVIRVRRGEPYVDGDEHMSSRLLPPPLPPANDFWKVDSAHPIRAGGVGAIEGLLVGATLRTREFNDRGAAIFTVPFEDGRFGAVEPRFFRESAGGTIHEIALASNEHYVAVGRGLVLTATRADAPPRTWDELGFEAESIAFDPKLDPPMVLGGRRGTILVGDLFGERGLALESASAMSLVRSVAFVEGVPHVGLDLPPMLRRESEGWKPLAFPLPESLAECAERERVCGRLVPGPHRMEGVAGLEDGTGRFAVTWPPCLGFAIVEPRPVEACVRGIPIPARELSEGDAPDLDDLLYMDGYVILAGNGGLLVEVRLEE